MNIDIKTKGRQVNQTDFQSMWDGSSDLVVDSSTGLPLGRVEVPKTANQVSRFVFVKDTDSGATCCYIQPRLKVEADGTKTPTSNGHFVRGAEVKVISGKNVIKISETDSKMTDYTVPVTPGLTDNLVTGLTNMCDVSKNPNLGDVYSHIKSHISFGLIAGAGAGGAGGALAGISLPDTVKKIQLAPESRLAHPIKTITKTRRVDTPDAYLVVAPHPNATKADRGGKALYFMPSLKDGSGNDIDITSSSEILSKGGLVVHRIRYDRNGEMKIDYYKDANSRAHFSIKATDPQIGNPTYGIKAWTDGFGVGDDGFDNPKALELRAKPKTYKGRRIVAGIVAGVVALGLVATAIAVPLTVADQNNRTLAQTQQTEYEEAYKRVPYEGDKAQAYGAQQAAERVAELGDGITLLNYNTVGNVVSVSVGGIYNVVNSPIAIYEQSEGSLEIISDGTVVGEDKFDYTVETINGFYNELGKQVAQEAKDNGVVVATRADSASKAVINYIYGVVDPLAPTSSLSSEDAMTEYVQDIFGDQYSGDQLTTVVSDAVDAYSYGYETKATELAIENPDLIINDGDRPVVDYENAELKSSVATTIAKLTETGKKYSADDINIAYSSHEGKVLFANTTDGTYLFKIDLTNGGKDTREITSTEDMISRINSADNCEESVKIDILLKRLKLDKAIENLKTTYANENGVSDPQIYITGHSVLTQSDANPNQFEISPKMVIVSNNGGRIEEKPAYTVKVDAGKDASINQMVAVSVFGDAVADKYPIYIRVENSDQKNVVYEDNDLVVDETSTQLENASVGYRSSSAQKIVKEKDIEL